MIAWKSIRGALWFVVILAALNFVFYQPKSNTEPDAGAPDIGGAFSMTDQNGRAVTEKDFLGKPMLVFFGFTNCPSICPTTLADMSLWLRELGDEGKDTQPILVTVDPERDTQAVLKAYLKPFDPRIIALTGTQAQLDGMMKAYKAFYKKVPLEGDDYTVDHTAMVYMMRADGTFKGTIDFHEPGKTALPKLRLLLADAKTPDVSEIQP